MSFATPFVEYLIIGTHTSIWVGLVVLAIFDIPFTDLSNWKSEWIVPIIPIIYLLGAIISPLATRILGNTRAKIKLSVYSNKDAKSLDNYKDEKIAYLSSSLYAAYSDRTHRVRLLGPAIFNWLFLGGAILLHIDISDRRTFISIVVIALLLSLLTFMAWRFQVKRLYEFRKAAIDVISENLKLNKIEKKTG